ncbi:hypothetical protein ElyMa_006629900 [Elysia marginata]|uniref:Uncharacterized protein n=1 Tax=Elysia marginata TaxID=1093978 RepID=A0AAV4IJJ5_9GAST|nr:hypothetical protein ElyMa_006629900 [Elysia marginata]
MADPPASAERHRGSPAKNSKHRSSPRRSARAKAGTSSTSSSRRMAQQAAGRGGKLPHATRRPRRGCCANPENRKGVGAVLFALGLPTLVAGVVMTVVAVTDDDQDGKYPPAFSAVGPILLVCAFLLFLSGFSLISPIIPNAVDHCFSFDDPTSFCRVHCPRLSHFIKPDPTASINRAAMDALKTEPGKPALKKPLRSPYAPQEPDNFEGVLSISKNLANDSEGSTLQNQQSTAHVTVVSETKIKPVRQKGVRFSESDAADDARRPRTVSASSDSSLLSLRHCKIYPKGEDGVWWTDANNDYTRKEWQDREKMTTDL